jgi:Spy/CpxP family protein refolding chaperone
MPTARRRIRGALRRLTLTEQQARLVRLLMREERRERETTERLLEECRRELRQALAPSAPDSATVLELSVKERLLLEQQRALPEHLERRIAGMLGPERASELRTLPPPAHWSLPAPADQPRTGV